MMGKDQHLRGAVYSLHGTSDLLRLLQVEVETFRLLNGPSFREGFGQMAGESGVSELAQCQDL